MVKEVPLAAQAAEALQRCLKEVPFVYGSQLAREPVVEGVRPDLLARLDLPQGEQLLLVEVKGSGQPRQVREAINQLYRLREVQPGAYPVVVAPYISPQAAEICAQEGVGYVDLAGNCRLAFGQVYIRQEGNPNPAPRKHQLRSLYAPRAARVLRVLLSRPGPWKMQPLAQEAGVSLGQAANVKRLLADREWIRTDSEGFALAQPKPLLAEWAANYSYRRNRVHDYYTLQSLDEFERALAAACRAEGVRCALTAFSAAARLAPAVRYQRATAYVEGEGIERLVHRLKLKQVSSGANVRLLVPYDEGVFYGLEERDGLSIVSPVQVYLDLQGPGGRGAEAAEALLEEVIKLAWHQTA